MQNHWPVLNFDDYKETLAYIHLCSQMVGKIRLIQSPWINHSWHVTLYVSPKGFSTGSIPYEKGIFEIEFDFVRHELLFNSSEGNSASIPLDQGSVSNFYIELFKVIKDLNVDCTIHAKPNEVDPAIPFLEDTKPRNYNPEQMHLLWQAFVQVHKVFSEFRSRFKGKSSPVHLFWGAFDIAVTRFSGKEAPEHPGGMPNIPLPVMQEAYSDEVSSAGFWPGGESFPQPSFYSYCYPTPGEFGKQEVLPKSAFYSQEMGEFFLPYDAVQSSSNPELTLMDFLQTTYEAAAKTGKWDMKAFEFDFKT